MPDFIKKLILFSLRTLIAIYNALLSPGDL
jgi:hypothetical protein